MIALAVGSEPGYLFPAETWWETFHSRGILRLSLDLSLQHISQMSIDASSPSHPAV